VTDPAASGSVVPGGAAPGSAPGRVDVRSVPGIRAGTFSIESEDLVTGWHHHDLHQLEYALTGVAEVESATGRFLLPPQQAVWIPAGVEHVTTLRSVRSVSVFFAPDMLLGSGHRVRILAAAPVIREMIVHAIRWPIARPSSSPEIDDYFEVLAHLVAEWLDQETPLWLPTTGDPLVSSAMAYTNENLSTVTEQSVCTEVGVSPRTLRRRFAQAVDLSWGQYLGQARVLRAMALLAESDDSVTEVSLGVGFDNLSSFTRAFRRYAGETPSVYRTRAHSGDPSG
jgi:AraC-like DNA-binding protein/mannose-6-phosphate isomerase-like protein (cupin superfamily)